MKLIIFTAIMFLSFSIAKGQQKLSYSYDAAGNRTNRTVVVDSQNPSIGDSQNEKHHTYIDSLGNNHRLSYPITYPTDLRGNIINYSYFILNNQYYIGTIIYSGNSVSFYYATTRPDRVVMFDV